MLRCAQRITFRHRCPLLSLKNAHSAVRALNQSLNPGFLISSSSNNNNTGFCLFSQSTHFYRDDPVTPRSRFLLDFLAQPPTPSPPPSRPKTPRNPKFKPQTKTITPAPAAAAAAAETMSSDEAYSNFLDKANQDTSSSSSKAAATSSSTNKTPATKSTDTDVPAPLQEIEGKEYYSSDADEPFEAVSLKWEGKGVPDEGMYMLSFWTSPCFSLFCLIVFFFLSSSKSTDYQSPSPPLTFPLPGFSTKRSIKQPASQLDS